MKILVLLAFILTSSGASIDPELRFLVTMKQYVRNYRANDINNFTELMVSDEKVFVGVDYHREKNFLFVSTIYELMRISLSSLNASEAEWTNLHLHEISNDFIGFAVDWVHDNVYWGNRYEDVIRVMSLDGRRRQILLKRPKPASNWVVRMEVDPYHKRLFWTVDGEIESCDLSGTSLLTNMADGIGGKNRLLETIALDRAEKRLYFMISWIGSSSHLYSMDYYGRNSHHHFTLQSQHNLFGLGYFQGHIYWLHNSYSSSSVTQEFYRAPVEGYEHEKMQLIATLDNVQQITQMRLFHPDLQKNPILPELKNPSSSDEEINKVLVLLLVVLILTIGLVYFSYRKYWTRSPQNSSEYNSSNQSFNVL